MFGITRSDTIVIVGAIALAVVTFMWVREQGAIGEREKQYKAQIEGFQKDVAAADKVARDLEVKLALLDEARAQLQHDLEIELARDPIYRDCKVPKEGVILLNQAITGAP